MDTRESKTINWLKSSLIAHRGLHNKDKLVPENSLLSFKKAIENGYAIECDVRISKDNIVYVFHDKNTKRMCNKDIIFENLDSSQITNLRLSETSEHIPTFHELLALVDGQVPLLIEVKSSKRYKATCTAMLNDLKTYKGIYAIQSFNPLVVNWFKKNDENTLRGLISESYGHPYQGPYILWKLYHSWLWGLISKPDFYNYNIKDLPNKKMDKFVRKGGTVISFTARSIEDLNFVRSKYDNAVFESFIPNQVTKKSL